MSPYVSVPFLFFLSLLQSTAWTRLQIGGVWPDVLLLVVMSWALLRGTGEAALWAFAGGIGLDLLSNGPFGASAAGLLVVVLLTSALQSGVFRGRTLLPLLVAFLGTAIFHVVYLLGMLLIGQRIDMLDAATRVILPQAVYNTALSPFVFRLMSGIHRRISPKTLEV
jgi:rod shape-determining protein MreD